MMPTPIHVPVLLEEILNLLALRPGATVIDATIDGGGHAAAILARLGPAGRLLGLDRDPEIAARAQTRFAAEIAAGRATVVNASFARLRQVAEEHGFGAVDAILFDLGLSSFHLDQGGRGFSFSRDEPLDLRFDPAESGSEPAAAILATRSAAELTELFREFGEERFASRIARAIAGATAPIERTHQLYDLIRANLPGKERLHAGRSAARIFQALRIAANDELGAVRDALPQALELLAPGGRLAVISFQSLEDRMVKQFFAAAQRDGRLGVISKRPLRPSDAEVEVNSRAASAKLRIAERRRADGGDTAGLEPVLRYWVGEDFSPAGCEERQEQWFRQSAATDNYIRERFGELVTKAVEGRLDAWAATARGRLALVILLDQFSRNLHRGLPQAFAGDDKALRLALDAIDSGMIGSLRPLERALFGMPLQHCERLEVQERSVRWFAALAAEADADLRPVYENFCVSARRHRDMIARFGRFPHRNDVLGRTSTVEETEFLRQPGSRF